MAFKRRRRSRYGSRKRRRYSYKRGYRRYGRRTYKRFVLNPYTRPHKAAPLPPGAGVINPMVAQALPSYADYAQGAAGYLPYIIGAGLLGYAGYKGKQVHDWIQDSKHTSDGYIKDMPYGGSFNQKAQSNVEGRRGARGKQFQARQDDLNEQAQTQALIDQSGFTLPKGADDYLQRAYQLYQDSLPFNQQSFAQYIADQPGLTARYNALTLPNKGKNPKTEL